MSWNEIRCESDVENVSLHLCMSDCVGIGKSKKPPPPPYER
jgi:hypothetical protein